MSESPVIPPRSLVAIVGISGYIASHCGLIALQAGYRVRGTVRSIERGRSLKEAYVKAGIQDIDSRLEIVILDDLDSVEQYHNAFKGVDAIVYSGLSWNEFGQDIFLDGPVNNTLTLFRAAKLVPSLQRIVYTSSIVTAIQTRIHRDKVITDEDWNDDAARIMAENLAKGKTSTPMTIYSAAKTKAERVAWEWMEKEKPDFDLVCVLPGFCSGPWLHGDPPSTAGWFAGLFAGDSSLPNTDPLPFHVDIRDCGRIHFECLRSRSVRNKRVVCANEPYGWNQVLGIMRKNFPHVKTIAEDLEPGVGDAWVQPFDNTPGKNMIGGSFIGVEESMVELGKCLGH